MIVQNNDIKNYKIDKKFLNLINWADNIYKEFHYNDFWICGGSVLKQYIGLNPEGSDIDLYFKNQINYDKIVSLILNNNRQRPLRSTKNADLYSYFSGKMNYNNMFDDLFGNSASDVPKYYKLDCVKIFSDSIEERLKDFDFTVSSIGIDNNKTIYFHESFQEDVFKHRLRINNWERANSSIFRLSKYMNLGFSLSYEDFCKLIDKSAEIMNIKISCTEDILKICKDTLEENKEMKLSTDFHLMDRVFCDKMVGNLMRKYILDCGYSMDPIEDFIANMAIDQSIDGIPHLLNKGDALNRDNVFKKVVAKISTDISKVKYFIKSLNEGVISKDVVNKILTLI